VVPVLADWKMETVEINAVFPAGRATKPSARAFAEYLVGALAEREGAEYVNPMDSWWA